MKQSIPKLKKKLDTIFSLKVRERDGFKCRKCGRVNKHNHCAHIFSRNSLSVRYEMKNAICLDYYCHLQWAHREPVEFTEWVKNEIGEKTYNELRKKSQTIIDDPRTFLELKEKELCSTNSPNAQSVKEKSNE